MGEKKTWISSYGFTWYIVAEWWAGKSSTFSLLNQPTRRGMKGRFSAGRDRVKLILALSRHLATYIFVALNSTHFSFQFGMIIMYTLIRKYYIRSKWWIWLGTNFFPKKNWFHKIKSANQRIYVAFPSSLYSKIWNTLCKYRTK